MSLEASSTPAKSPAFAGKARATAAVHPEKSARHPSARTTARMTCIVVPLALPACNRVLTTSNLATVVGSMVHAACFLQHGVCGLFSVEAGGDSRRLSKCGQRPTGRPAAALRWGRALGHECGSRPRATRCQICIDAPPGRRGSLVRNAAARHDERPTEATCEACWVASGKSQAEGALRRAFLRGACCGIGAA